MSEIKYIYRQINNNHFRIKIEKITDSVFENGIRYQIQEPADIPRNRRERIKQWFAVREYDYGYWFPILSEETFEKHLLSKMEIIIENLFSKICEKTFSIVFSELKFRPIGAFVVIATVAGSNWASFSKAYLNGGFCPGVSSFCTKIYLKICATCLLHFHFKNDIILLSVKERNLKNEHFSNRHRNRKYNRPTAPL